MEAKLRSYVSVGLNVRWWELGDLSEKVKKLIDKSDARIWYSKVKSILETNKGTDWPSSWRELRRRVRISQKHAPRHAETVPPLQVRHKYASALGLDNRALSPSTEEVVAMAAWQLLGEAGSSTPPLSEGDALAYAAYVLRASKTESSTLNSELLQAMLREFEPAADKEGLIMSIVAVAEQVGRMLVNDGVDQLWAQALDWKE